MKIATEPLYGGALIDTETIIVKIKQIVLNDLRNGKSEREIKAKVKKLIDEFAKKIDDPMYKQRATAVLVKSFAKWYATTNTAVLALPFLIASRFKNAPTKVVANAEKQMRKLSGQVIVRLQNLYPNYIEYGQEWHDREYRRQLKEAYTRYAIRLADDPARYNKTVSLRNLAEVEVRRQEINAQLAQLRAQGVRLAWASSHVDCSKRCSPWQGRLYSLDGTYGTQNGNSFVPIEVAINVIDKYGYVNGLFGFNCRHRLIPYTKGSRPPQDYTHEQMTRERAIDKRQRELERIIRKWKMRGFVLQKENWNASLQAFERARMWTERYKKYSREHGRQYYTERITLLREEIQQNTK